MAHRWDRGRRRAAALALAAAALVVTACTTTTTSDPTVAPATTVDVPATVVASSASPGVTTIPALVTSGPDIAGPTTIAPTTPTTDPPRQDPPRTDPPATRPPDPNRPPRVDVAAWAVYDMRAGQMLAQRKPNAKLQVGSLMKLLTAEVAYAAGDPTRQFKMPAGLLISQDESNIGLIEGEKLPRDLLIRAMLIVSANDAARALAIDIAGSEAAFAGLMNDAAARLRLDHTRAVNATGLDADGQYSSADDMVRLGVRLMANPSFQLTVRRRDATLHDLLFPATNDLLGIYPGADGIKTGRTSEAGWCILASATRDGRRIVVAVIGAPTEEARNAAAIGLLDWGFSQ